MEQVIKSCSTCEHRKGSIVGLDECTFSGLLCQVTKRHPECGCGPKYEGWVKRRGLIQRIKELF